MSPEKQKAEESDTQSLDNERTRRTQPSAAAMAKQTDGRRSPDQLKRNQERLGVGPDHRTPAMKKGRRGTFP
jgi:hypothetical protein